MLMLMLLLLLVLVLPEASARRRRDTGSDPRRLARHRLRLRARRPSRLLEQPCLLCRLAWRAGALVPGNTGLPRAGCDGQQCAAPHHGGDALLPRFDAQCVAAPPDAAATTAATPCSCRRSACCSAAGAEAAPPATASGRCRLLRADSCG